MRKRNSGFTLIEIMVVIGVVAILALMAVPSFQERIVRDQIIEALPLAEIAKAPVDLSWSLGLPLPDSNDAAGLPPADKIVSNLVSSVSVRGGAINVTFGNHANSALKGKVLTLRPAVVADAPIVPVAWVCGNSTPPEKMTVKGENRTNIPAAFLPLKCRP